MSRCKEFYEKWERYPNWCEKSPEAVSRINRYIDFLNQLESQGIPKDLTLGMTTERSIRPLFEECGDITREKVLDSVKKCLESGKHPADGRFITHLSSDDVREIVRAAQKQEMIPYVSIEELPKPDTEPESEPEPKPKKIEEWKRPFQRPRIISEGGEQVQIQLQLSAAEFDFMRLVSEGMGMLDLSRAYDCDVATIHREIRVVAQKIMNGKAVENVQQ